MPPDFCNIATCAARVMLIEAGPRVLAGFAEGLAAYAQRSLERLGVEVELRQTVSARSSNRLVLGDRHHEAGTIIPPALTGTAAASHGRSGAA